jgi:hypothetical protein
VRCAWSSGHGITPIKCGIPGSPPHQSFSSSLTSTLLTEPIHSTTSRRRSAMFLATFLQRAAAETETSAPRPSHSYDTVTIAFGIITLLFTLPSICFSYWQFRSTRRQKSRLQSRNDPEEVHPSSPAQSGSLPASIRLYPLPRPSSPPVSSSTLIP